METKGNSAPHDLPRCIGADAQGRRWHEPVVWDHVTNRPLSTRCQTHGGLMDAALFCWDPQDMKETTDKT